MSEHEYAHARDDRLQPATPTARLRASGDVEPTRASVVPEFPAAGSNGALKLTVTIPQVVLSGRGGLSSDIGCKVLMWMTSLSTAGRSMSDLSYVREVSMVADGNGHEIFIPASIANYDESKSYFGVVTQILHDTTLTLVNFSASVFTNVPGQNGQPAGDPLTMTISGMSDGTGSAAQVDLVFANGVAGTPDGVQYYAKLWAVPLPAGATVVDYDPSTPTAQSSPDGLPGSLAHTLGDGQVTMPSVGFVAELRETALGSTEDALVHAVCQIFDVNSLGGWAYAGQGLPNPTS